MKKHSITASEAIYGFAGWLTTRKGCLKVGSKYDASVMAKLVAEWCNCNQLPTPRKVFPNNIVHPKSHE